LAPYFCQEGVDLLITNSANRSSVPLFQFMQASKLPLTYFNQVLSWVVNYRSVVSAALHKKGHGWAAVLGWPAAAALRGYHVVTRRNRSGCRAAKVDRSEAFDERFNCFWRRLAEKSACLLALRDRTSMQWHFEFALRNDRVRILTLEQNGQMEGYAILLRELRQAGQLLDRYLLVDLQVLEANAESVESLIAAAIDLARAEGVDVLDTIGFGLPKRRLMEAMRPYVRVTDRWPFWYKAAKPTAGLDLSQPETWDATLFDGDATIWNDCSRN
jgi:hypothetical protein